MECPFSDQGLVRPLRTVEGPVVFMCDAGGEVWLALEDVRVVEPVIPGPPDWSVGPGLSITPGETAWVDDPGSNRSQG